VVLPNLFSSIKLTDQLLLDNRIVMAPMTRCKAIKNLVPNPEMAAYYAKRADSALIITEATIICPNAQGYPNTPGIFKQEQVNGWSEITRAVHDNNGRIFLQLWHVGRVSHPMYLDGEKPIAPSPIAIAGRVPYTKLPYEAPRALESWEIPEYVDLYRECSENAMSAGFDGVEIHAGNGYLIDQFLHFDTNRRSDCYGGSPEKNSHFLLEVVESVARSIGSKRVGVRLSPEAYVHGIMPHSEDKKTFIFALKQLEKLNIAYVHTSILNDQELAKGLGDTVSGFVRQNYSGKLIVNGGYTAETAEKKLQNNEADLVSFARAFLANPDLVKRLREKRKLEPYESSILMELN